MGAIHNNLTLTTDNILTECLVKNAKTHSQSKRVISLGFLSNVAIVSVKIVSKHVSKNQKLFVRNVVSNHKVTTLTFFQSMKLCLR